MARFRPSKLFRRFSSRSDVHSTQTKSRSASQHSRSPPLASTDLPTTPPPPPAVYTVPTPGTATPGRSRTTSRSLRKSSSLPRLRKRSNTAGTARSAKSGHEAERDREESVPAVPEVKEGAPTLSVQLGRETSAETGTGSEWESGGRISKGSAVEVASRKEEASAEHLGLETTLSRKPVVVVEHPTPDVVEEVRVVQQQGSPESQQFQSGQNTLASSSPAGEQGQIEDRSASAAVSGDDRQGKTPAQAHIRRPSIIDSANAKAVKTLLDAPAKGHDRNTSDTSDRPTTSATEYLSQAIPNMAAMLRRKIWVKRPGASATLVQIKEDDLVDDVRDMILRKYANSLGRTFDAPDMTLHILSRPEHGANRMERTLGPEEELCGLIDQMYPGGQTVEEALVINVPQRRTPKASPRVFHQPQYQATSYHAMDDFRPLENGTDYFPPMPANEIPTTIPQTTSSHDSRTSAHLHSVTVQPASAHPDNGHPRAMSVLTTGHVPALPSPGGTTSRRHGHRPKINRLPTSSPTILSHPNAGAVAVAPPAGAAPPHIVHRASTRPRLDSSASEAHRPNGIAVPAPPPLPTPPAPEAPPTNKDNSAPPTPSAGVAPVGVAPHGRIGRPKKTRKPTPETQNVTGTGRRKKDSSSASSPHPASSIASMLDASVPPINVLIVEDNIINLRILEGLMKRLKVRWQTAMNGQIAVDKWKAGGFHLVLMDIQMPVMNGLQATKEIRRLERSNSIGVFSSASPDDDEKGPDGALKAAARATSNGEASENDKTEKKDDTLPGLSSGLIKSPVIIVALTASSLQSDRHEALAAGCNDFLTKPVNFVWLERKVKEWGCMQALIDFDGWRKWKEYAAKEEAGKTEEEKQKEREKEEKERVKAEKMAKLQEKQAKAKEERERKKRASMGASETAAAAGTIPGSPNITAQKKEEGEVNGAPLESQTSAGLRPGKQVMGEAGMDIG